MTRQLIVGMPESGKSTFIAALRHLLLSGTISTELTLTRLADEERHLNDLETDWLELKEVQRTKPATEGWVEFHVKDAASGTESVLLVPDLRGETFEQPACSGLCQDHLYEAVIDASGIALFTSAEREDDALMISDLGDLLDDRGEVAFNEAGSFDPYGMPEEVKIVEFLQMANRRPLLPKRRRVALMASAWDVIPSGRTPEAWLTEKRPMLAQFLQYNPELWDLRVYGVSAQGGRLPQDRKRLKSMKPAERIRIVGHGAKPHDLTAPLRWLAGT